MRRYDDALKRSARRPERSEAKRRRRRSRKEEARWSHELTVSWLALQPTLFGWLCCFICVRRQFAALRRRGALMRGIADIKLRLLEVVEEGGRHHRRLLAIGIGRVPVAFDRKAHHVQYRHLIGRHVQRERVAR